MALILLPLTGGCGVLRHGLADHAGPIAAAQWHLYLIVGAVLVFVAGPVLLLVPLFAWRYRLGNERAVFKPKWDFSWPIEGLIWIPPAGIVIGLGFLLWHYTTRLDPYRPLASASPALQVQAVAFDWKWLFLYPGEGIATVNELDIPVGRPVHLTLTSGTVMQSFMAPQLAGQIYAMPGMKTQLNLAASRAGSFRGLNTQYNGAGFPHERFAVVARPAGDHARWVAHVRASARPLDTALYARVAARSIVARPIAFSSAPPGLFDRIVAATQAPAR